MDISTSFPKMTEIVKQQRELQSKLDKTFVSELKAFIKDLPAISGIEWVQYTPYFNDGDPCTFCVYGVNVYLESGHEIVKNAILANPELKNKLCAHENYEEEEDEDQDEDSEVVEEKEPKEYFLEDSDWSIRGLTTPELQAVLDKAFALSSILDNCQSTLESKFGDGYRVRLSKTGITTEDYSHD